MISLEHIFPSIFAVLFSSIAVIELFLLSRRFNKSNRRKILLICVGIFFSVTFHSIIELLSTMNYISLEFTFVAMNFLLIFGSSFFVLAALLSAPKIILNFSSRPISILHIDDDEDILQLTKMFCERNQKDFSFTSISDPLEAINLLSKQNFDAVISDYEMPGMNGLEILEKLRKEGNVIPFIMFTGKGREEVAMKALNLGADHYLVKSNDSIETLYTELIHIILQTTTHQRTEEALIHTNKIYSPLAPLISEKNTKKYWAEYRDLVLGFSIVMILFLFDIVADFFFYFSGSAQEYLADTFFEHLIFLSFGALISFLWWKKGTSLNLIKSNFTQIVKEKTDLKTKNQELEDFTIQMSHDLKGNLQIINSYSILLEENEGNEKFSHVIRKQTRKINDLVTRSLELARLGVAINKNDFIPLNEIIEEAKSLLPMKIMINADKLPSVNCDRLKVVQIFQNIFENAINHGKATIITITYKFEDFNHKIEIINNGEVIPPNERKMLLKHKGISKKENHGFGLFIVQKLVEAHKWQIDLSSKNQPTFVLTIPG